jgi:hypothetical protein
MEKMELRGAPADRQEAKALIPDTAVYTRQQARADKRSVMKSLRGLRKADAMTSKQPGGSAVVR